MREHVFPLTRLTDDATASGAGFELAGEGGDLRLEACRGLTCRGIAASGLRKTLMRQRQRQVIGDASSEADVFVAELIGFAREEEQRSKHRVAEWHRHPQQRANAEPVEHPAAHGRRWDFGLDV